MEMKKEKIEWSVIEMPNFFDASQLYEEPPWERGMFKYVEPGKVFINRELQVPNSLARYNHPKFKELHYEVMYSIEEIIGEKLYPTYYYDRFYFKGNELKKHVDRNSCEVSVTMNISHNLDYDWGIFFEKPDESSFSCITNPGDAALYKGCIIPHWREPMKGNKNSYYHQIFLHYVRRNGHCVEHAYDMGGPQ